MFPNRSASAVMLPIKMRPNVIQSWNLFISDLTGKKMKIYSNKLPAIQEHLLCCNYSPSFQDFSILTSRSNDFNFITMENLLIERDKPVSNKADSAMSLELYVDIKVNASLHKQCGVTPHF